MGDTSPPALRLTGVSKSFPGVRALKNVTFDVRAGEVHGLVGENGAGKSTLVAVAAGILVPEEGTVEIGNARLGAAGPRHARELGVGIVRQEPALLPHLTVAENLVLGLTSERRPTLAHANGWARAEVAKWGDVAIDPTARVAWLAPDERFIVDMTRALAQEPAVLILDEPTEHIGGADVSRLFDRIRARASAGCAVVYISHRLFDVKTIADRITVLRDGAVRGTFAADAVSERQIINLVVGRPVETAFPPKPQQAADGDPMLTVEGLEGPGFSAVSFGVGSGEILGFAGIEGNGQREVVRALAGLSPFRGSVALRDGTRVKGSRADKVRKAGISYIPRDRHAEGLFQTLSVRENLTITSLEELTRFGVIDQTAERTSADDLIRTFRVRVPDAETPIDSLSGGNQQKVVLARLLSGGARVLLADEPTQGVDVGARVEIYRLIRDFATDGGAVVVVSSDALELEGLCDRVLVFSRGHVVQELTGEALSEQRITAAELTATTTRHRGSQIARTPLLRRLSGDWTAPAVLAVVTVLAGVYAAAVNDFYLTTRNFSGMLALFATLSLVALGQQIVMLTGGIDLSVGPLMGFVVVVASFFLTDDAPVGPPWVGWALVVLVPVAVGVVNWALIDLARLQPIVATLVTFMALQGLSLMLRPVPGGLISTSITDVISKRVWFVPAGALVGVAAGLGLEYALRRSTWGVSTRATGSRASTAREVGVNVLRTRLMAYVACSLLAGAGGVLLMAQVGSGTAGAGLGYTLSSIAAVVLGGTSVFGGRGSFVGTLMGAFLLQQVITITTFLRLGEDWQFYLLGGLTLIAVAVYSKTRAMVEA